MLPRETNERVNGGDEGLHIFGSLGELERLHELQHWFLAILVRLIVLGFHQSISEDQKVKVYRGTESRATCKGRIAPN